MFVSAVANAIKLHSDRCKAESVGRYEVVGHGKVISVVQVEVKGSE